MEIGDYVRTTEGYIGKITDIIEDLSIDCDTGVFDFAGTPMCEIPYNLKDKYIIKSSPNIIDLIEVGDFVNGEQIMDIRNDDNVNNETLLYYYIPSDYGEDCFRNKDIKSIVTKEQFESIKYEVNNE